MEFLPGPRPPGRALQLRTPQNPGGRPPLVLRTRVAAPLNLNATVVNDRPTNCQKPAPNQSATWISLDLSFSVKVKTMNNQIVGNRVPETGGQAVQVTRNRGYVAFEFPDGAFVYYAKSPYTSSLWRIPVEGGDEVEILKSVIGNSFALANNDFVCDRS